MEEKKSVSYLVGQVMAYIDSTIPGGLTAEKRVLIVQNPEKYIVSELLRATRLEYNQELAGIIENIQAWPGQQDEAAQGQSWLGYYGLRAKLPTNPLKKNGRRLKQDKIDWSSVDWSKPDKEIADELHYSRQYVGRMRKSNAAAAR